MRLTRAIGVLAAGAVAVWWLERHREAQPSVFSPQFSETTDHRPQTTEPEPEPEPEAVERFVPSEQPTREQPAVEREEEAEPVDVTDVVEDLITPSGGGEGAVVDAEIVEDEDRPPA